MGAIQNDWLQPLSPEFKKPYYASLYKKIREEYSTRQIFRLQMKFLLHLS